MSAAKRAKLEAIRLKAEERAAFEASKRKPPTHKPAADGLPLLDAVTEEVIFEERSEGASTASLRRRYGVTAQQFQFWLGTAEGPSARAIDEDGRSRRQRWDDLTPLAAEARADLATTRLEALIEELGERAGRMKMDVSKEEIALLKALAEQDRWEAGNLNPSVYRPNAPPNVTNNVTVTAGDLYLTAVRAEGGGAALGGNWKTPVALADPTITDVEPEFVTDGDS